MCIRQLLTLSGDEAVVVIAPLRHSREIDVIIDRRLGGLQRHHLVRS
jgi:hypothetical protein